MTTVMCRTEGCENAGHAIEMTLDYTDDEGNPARVDSVQCGVCGNEITEVTE
jgi:hypothetical protein